MSDEQPLQPIQEYTLRQRLWIYAILLLCAPSLAYLAIRILMVTLPLNCSCGMLFLQIPVLMIAALMLALAFYLVGAPIKRKITTGKFLLGRAEAMRKRRENWAKLGAGKPARQQFWLWFLPVLGSFFLLWVGTVAIVAARNGFAPTHLRNTLAMLTGIAFLCGALYYPFVAIRRRVRTGYFLPSEEDLAKRRARCAEPKPLRTRIFMAAIWWFNAALWTDSAIDHIRHPGHHIGSPPWLAAGASCLAAAIWTWQVFFPKPSQCALPFDENGSTSIDPKDSGPQFKLL